MLKNLRNKFAAFKGAVLAHFGAKNEASEVPPPSLFHYRSIKPRHAGRPKSGTKVARALGHDGVYHSGALNKDNYASAWALAWNRSVGTRDERFAAAHRDVAEWCAQ